MLDKAINAVEAGQFKTARKWCRKILKGQPGDFDAQHLLGIIALRQKEYRTAVAAFKRAQTLNPGSAPVANNLGVAYTSLAYHRDALDCYWKAVQLDASNLDFVLNLARCSERCGYWQQAIEFFQLALRLGGNLSLHVALSRLYRTIGDFSAAEHHINQYVAQDPFLTEALIEKAAVYERLYGDDSVIEMYQKVIAEAPGRIDIRNRYVEELRNLGRREAAIEENLVTLELDPTESKAMWELSGLSYYKSKADLEKLRQDLSLPDLHSDGERNKTSLRANTAHTLFRALDEMDQYEEAGQLLIAANTARRTLLNYDEDKDIAFIAKTQKVFAEIEPDQNSGLSDTSPVFILGMPRSGTTLIEQILSSHSSVQAAGELPTLLKILESEGTDGAFLERFRKYDRSQLVDVAQRYLASLKSYSGGAKYIIDKNPSNFLFIGAIRMLFPGATIIHCVRDPIDTCFSCYKKFFVGDLPHMYDQLELGRYYNRYTKLMDFWKQYCGDSFVEVSYESVVGNFKEEAMRLLQTLGLEWEPGIELFYQNSRSVKTASSLQVREKLYSTSIESWRAYESTIGPLMECLEAG